jgi:thiol-disulfide isomerase/thioredoxin
MKFSRILMGMALSAAIASAQFAPLDEAAEEKVLRQSLAEAGNSPIDFLRAIETHLARYPLTKQREALELAATKAAIDLRDQERIILYGERVLARDSSDATLLERVARMLLVTDDKARAERALKYSIQLEKVMRDFTKDDPSTNRARAVMADELDRAVARAITYQARATGNLGKIPEAIQLARKAYDTFPSAEAAREAGRWLARSGKEDEALGFYVKAFAVPDDKNPEEDRVKDRTRAGELHRKLKGSDQGLGDLILRAYDEGRDRQAQRAQANAGLVVNGDASAPLDFTLSDISGGSLKLASLRGKVVVMDFWATWCGPCRGQYPLYEKTKERFHGREDVVFLHISTDQDKSLVKPFIEENKWHKTVYFEDGLGAHLQVTSIPSTIILDPSGKVFSRMNGYIPERFVDMLTDRINEALKVPKT